MAGLWRVRDADLDGQLADPLNDPLERGDERQHDLAAGLYLELAGAPLRTVRRSRIPEPLAHWRLALLALDTCSDQAYGWFVILARVSSHVRHNVVGYLALFVALGGTSYAATQLPRNSVGTKQLKKGAVTSRKLANGAVTGSKVANNSLTGREINSSTLGTVPNAAHATDANNTTDLGGLPASAYIQSPVGPSRFGTLPAVRATNSSSEDIASGARTSLTFDTNDYDNSGMHSTSTNTTRLTAPISGIYEISGDVFWTISSTGSRAVFIVKNGSVFVAVSQIPVNSASEDTGQEVSTQVNLNAGDYVELTVQQDSGSIQDVSRQIDMSPIFAMHWLGP